MAFGYRKRDPGSGGSRPGAGRRPDISPQLRFRVGAFCADQYRQARARFHRDKWLNEVVEIWVASDPPIDERRELHEVVLFERDLTTTERRFVDALAFYDDELYTSDGVLRFAVDDVLTVAGYIPRFNLHCPPFPQRRGKIPRFTDASIKRRIVEKAKVFLSSTGIFGVSDGFIRACWAPYRG